MGEPSKQLSLPPAPLGSRYPKYKGWVKSSTPADKFMPHAAKPVVTVDFVIPKVFFTPEALRDMYHIVDLVDGEVGWFGIVEEIDNDYLVKSVILPGQHANSGTCELTPQGIAVIASEIMRTNPADGMDIVNSIRFWGHSHHSMGTSPSGQDDQQLAEAATDCEDFFIRAILNKKGRMEITVYAYSDSLIFKDVEWSVYDTNDNSRREYWENEVANKVKAIEHQQGALGSRGNYIDVGHGRKRWVPDAKDESNNPTSMESWHEAWHRGEHRKPPDNEDIVYGELVNDGLYIGKCSVCDKAIYYDDNFDGQDYDGETVWWHMDDCTETKGNSGGESIDGLLHPLEND